MKLVDFEDEQLSSAFKHSYKYDTTAVAGDCRLVNCGAQSELEFLDRAFQ
jgi:hypothetical protein